MRTKTNKTPRSLSTARILPKAVLLCLALLCACALPAMATDYYMSVSGTGTKDGSSWANALSGTSMVTVVDTTMVAGDTLYLEGANYTSRKITISSSGTPTACKKIIGVDRGAGLPLFQGTSAGDTYGISFNAGASYWEIQNLIVHYHGYCVQTLGTNVGLILDNITAWNTKYGMAFVDSDDMVVQNCKASRYVYQGFYIHNNCDRGLFKNCEADCTEGDVAWQGGTIGPCGFAFNLKTATGNPNTDITLQDCVSHNNRQDGTGFTQGDGYMVQVSDTGVVLNDGIHFIHCSAYDNNDGAYDLKGLNQTLDNCIGMRSRYGFKIWRDTTLTNCIATHNGTAGVYAISGGNIYANYCTLHDTGQSAKVEGGVTGTIDLKNCLCTFSGTTGTFSVGAVNFNIGTADETKKHFSAGNPANAPMYLNPVNPWNGTGTNYDNLTYGLTKGYNSTANMEEDLSPEADAFVRDGTYATTNYGTSPTLDVKADATSYRREAYLRFDLGSYLTPVTSARLKLVVVATGTSAAAGALSFVATDTWTETGLIWNNKPASSTVLSTWTPPVTGEILEIDVTAQVNTEIAGDKKLSLKVTNTTSGSPTNVSYGSRENTDPTARPVLEITP